MHFQMQILFVIQLKITFTFNKIEWSSSILQIL